MVGLPVFGETSRPAVRRPVLRLSLGRGNADEWSRAVTVVAVELGLGPAVDALEIVTAAGESSPAAAVGDATSVAFGFEDDGDPQVVFTGEIAEVVRSVTRGRTIRVFGGARVLARLRVNQSYEQQSAGAIVRDLADRGGIDTATVDDGPDFPFYALDDRASALDHVAALARKSGFVAYFTSADELNFGPVAQGQAVQSFSYGQDIIALRVAEHTPGLAKVKVVGEGAASSNGGDAWAWIAKQPPTAGAGTGDPERLLSDSSLRTADAARRAAEGAIAAAAGHAGTLVVAGAPLVTPTSSIEIAGCPDPSLDGPCLARTVRHRYSKHGGFTSTIGFVRTGGASGASALAGALL
jgi:hypothetical protein